MPTQKNTAEYKTQTIKVLTTEAFDWKLDHIYKPALSIRKSICPSLENQIILIVTYGYGVY
jgi:hypothetical protein